MVKLTFKAESFKKMEDPFDKERGHTKYICYAQVNTIPRVLEDWMNTNPREQKMTTNVAKEIIKSLEENKNFHELNRGVVLSVDKVTYDNKKKEVEIILDDPEIHGNIDGGHTLKAIFDLNDKGILDEDRYVFFEIFTGIDSPVELAAARNTSVQVDLKSIEELKKSFDVLKQVLEPLPFSKRIAYKMNQHHDDDEMISIDIREVLAIITMFSQTLYPYKKEDGTLNDQQPIQCYTGKEATLKKFVSIDKDARDDMIKNMRGILQDIFEIWEDIETNFNKYSLAAGKRYIGRKYAKYNDEEIVSKSLFGQEELHYDVPKGMIYPIVGSFRALIKINPETNQYEWNKNPKVILEKMAAKLVGIVLDEKTENPELIGKNANLWSNLFKEVYIESYLL